MTTITTSVGDLRHALRAAVAFAGDENEIPSLAAVYIEAGGGVLTATATNRYVFGHARVKATGDWANGALVDQEQVRWVADGLKMLPASDLIGLALIDATVTSGPRLRIEHPSQTVEVLTQQHVGPTGKPWVDYQAIFKQKFEDREPPALTTPVLLSPQVVTQFADAAELFEGQSARWTFFGPLDPVRVEIGDSFVALLMPSRPTDRTKGIWPVPVGVPAFADRAAAEVTRHPTGCACTSCGDIRLSVLT